jgi:hypothetical protein
MKPSLVRGFIISTFVSLYLVVSLISTIHVIDFFKLSNPSWLAISLAIAFEIGAAASLASIIALDKMNKSLIWFLFAVLTMMQMMGNTYYAFTHLENYQSWVELFGLVEEEPIYQKRFLAILSGAILPLVALGFVKSLVDYIRPDNNNEEPATEEPATEEPATEEPATEEPATEEPATLEKVSQEPVINNKERAERRSLHPQIMPGINE